MKSINNINREAYDYAVAIGQHFNQPYKAIKNLLGVEAFAYMRYLENGSFLFFGAGCEEGYKFQKFYFLLRPKSYSVSKNYFNFVQSLFHNDTRFYIYPLLKAGFSDCKDLASIGFKSGCGFCRKTTNYVEDFRFAFKEYRSPKILISMINDIEAFIKHLNLQFKTLLYNEKHIVATHGSNIKLNLVQPNSEKQNKHAFLEFLAQQDVHLKTLHTLSNQEYNCLQYMVEGKTMKDIGDLLNISSRTVETYINNVKTKTGCYFKSKLIDKFFYHFRDKQH